MKKLIPGVEIVGNDTRIPGLTRRLVDNDELRMGTLCIRALWTPCHTHGSLSYHVKSSIQTDTGHGVVFTGDTLFIGLSGNSILRDMMRYIHV